MTELSRRAFLRHTAGIAAGVAAAAHARAEVKATASAADAEVLQAGVAVRDITPGSAIPLWGYSEGPRLSTGTLDPLQAKAVVFRVGDKAVGLVSMDLGRVPVKESCARIRGHAKDFGLDNVILAATHTHSGPSMELPGLPHLESTENAIVEVLRVASEAMQPVQVSLGRGRIDIAHNRRLIKDGKCYMRWRNAERLPTTPLDQEAGVIRIDTRDGKPLAILVNYACHPVIFGPDNMRYSADWPGEMCRTVKEATGAECVFLQGGCGDINPYLDKTPLSQGADEAMRSEGRKAGEAVLAALGSMTPISKDVSALGYWEKPVKVGMRWNLSDPKQAQILKTVYGAAYEFYVANLSPDLAVPLGVLVLNRRLALAFLPGEPFVQLQLDLKAHSPLYDTFLCGYANEYHAYFPTVRDAAIGGYGGMSATYVGVGAGEKLVTEATILVGQMIGKLGPAQSATDFASEEMT